METISKFINMIIIVFGLFIVTTVINAKQADRVMQESVTTIVTKFSDNVRRQGKITPEMYNKFVKQLDAEGILFNIEMVYSKEVYNPSGTNSYVNTEDCYYTQEILDGLFCGGDKGKAIDGKDDGVVTFRKEDTFSIHVTNKTDTFGMKFSKFVPWFSGNQQAGIDTYAGGLIRDELEG